MEGRGGGREGRKERAGQGGEVRGEGEEGEGGEGGRTEGGLKVWPPSQPQPQPVKGHTTATASATACQGPHYSLSLSRAAQLLACCTDTSRCGVWCAHLTSSCGVNT